MTRGAHSINRNTVSSASIRGAHSRCKSFNRVAMSKNPSTALGAHTIAPDASVEVSARTELVARTENVVAAPVQGAHGAHSVRSSSGDVVMTDIPSISLGAHSIAGEGGPQVASSHVQVIERPQHSKLVSRLIRFGGMTARVAALTAAVTLGVSATGMGAMVLPQQAQAIQCQGVYDSNGFHMSGASEDTTAPAADAWSTQPEAAPAPSPASSETQKLDTVSVSNYEADNASANGNADDTQVVCTTANANTGTQSDSEASNEANASSDTSHTTSADSDAASVSTNIESDGNASDDSSDSSDSSKNDSPRHEDEIPAGADQTHNDTPGAPVGGSAQGIAPAAEPEFSGLVLYSMSNDEIPIASSSTGYDSNAPPGASARAADPPLENGTYFIRWNAEDQNWLGEVQNKIEFYQGPLKGMPVLWKFDLMSDNTYQIRVTGQGVELYLVRTIGENGQYVLDLVDSLDSVDPDSHPANWRVIKVDDMGDDIYLIGDYNGVRWLGAEYDEEGHPELPLTFTYDKNIPDDESSWNLFWKIGVPTAQDFVVTYVANGGDGDFMTPTQVDSKRGANIAECAFTRFGYDFAGWNTMADGSGVTYMPGSFISGTMSLSPGFILKLYAQWEEAYVELRFVADRGGELAISEGTETGNFKDDSIYVSVLTGMIKDSTATISDVFAIALKGYHFDSWTLEGGLGEISDFFRYESTLTAADIILLAKGADADTGKMVFKPTTFTAHFLSNSYTIKFNSNGGTGSVNPMSVLYGDDSCVSGGSALKRTGYKFAGWNTLADGTGVSVADGASIEHLLDCDALKDADGADSTLYAQWNEEKTEPAPADNDDNQGSTEPSAPRDENVAPSAPAAAPAIASTDEGFRARSYAQGLFDVPVAEAAELDSFSPAFTEIKTTGGLNGGIFDTIGEFFSTDTGKIAGIIVAAGLLIALAAGLVALWMNFAGGSAANVFGRKK